MPHHQCTIHLNCENIEMIDDAYQDALKGKISQAPMIEMTIPSVLDDSLAPPGCVQYKNLQILIDQATAEKVVIIFAHGVRPSITKTKTCCNAARKFKHALRRTPCVKLMTTFWLWPGGSS